MQMMDAAVVSLSEPVFSCSWDGAVSLLPPPAGVSGIHVDSASPSPRLLLLLGVLALNKRRLVVDLMYRFSAESHSPQTKKNSLDWNEHQRKHLIRIGSRRALRFIIDTEIEAALWRPSSSPSCAAASRCSNARLSPNGHEPLPRDHFPVRGRATNDHLESDN